MTEPQYFFLRVAAFTHTGARRSVNEDCIAVGSHSFRSHMSEPWDGTWDLDRPCVCLVADGMGGHPAGDVASRMAVEHLISALPQAHRAEDTIAAALRDANRTLVEAMHATPALFGMGTTIAGLVAHASAMTVFNVGDSRVYRIYRRRLKQLSIDHTTAAPAVFRRAARLLSQCLGGYPPHGDIEPHVVRQDAAVGADYLIVSDGVHDMLSDREIERCLDPDVPRSVRNLFECAMDEGGTDNISIIRARVERGL
ncbi:MAG: serine/threonine-protein phosphatase [Burkholderiales bacterium]|nr:serine/threonine-protein phosphatase [Burkholderiales bacterium]